MPRRFRDSLQNPNGTARSRGAGKFDPVTLVRCPRCSACASVAYLLPDDPRRAQVTASQPPYRVVCRPCGFNHQPEEYAAHSGRDDTREYVTGLPLWLQIPCAGQVLWAWNGAHLDFLEEYVAADLRERTPNVNVSMASRLPRWIKSAKHRDEVLRAIVRLGATLPDWAQTTPQSSETYARADRMR